MKTINKQIIASILLTMLIVFGGWGFLEVRSIIHFEEHRLNTNQANTIKRLAYNLGNPLWNLNQQDIEKIIQYETVDENILAILVYDEDLKFYTGFVTGNTADRAKKFDNNNPKHQQLQNSGDNRISRNIIYQGKLIGKVVIYPNNEPLKIKIWNLKVNLIIKILILMLIITIVQFLILRKVVIQPLKQLTNWVTNITHDKIVEPPHLLQSKEVETLFEAFKNMTNKLSSNLNEILDKNAKLIQSEIQLNSWNEELIATKIILQQQILDYEISQTKLAEEIEERKKIEIEIAKLNSELEEKVLARTAQLETSNKELEAFSYSVSHDLRAPLRHINGFTELLAIKFGDVLPDKARQYLKTITSESKQMGNLIDDLLRFSRIGKTVLQITNVDMNNMVNDTIEFLTHGNHERVINWNVSELPAIAGDSSMLKQVWVNLLSNAVKYSGTREIANIKIFSKESEDSVTYYIQDNGVGFDMQYSDKLFGVFQRLHSLSEFEGTGIGLANVRRIVLRHNGQVFAEGEINNGATFYFTLPKI